MKRLIYAAVFAVAVVATVPMTAEAATGIYNSKEVRFRIVEVADNLSSPWGMAFLPDGGILVTERTGGLKRIDGGSIRTISGAPRVVSIRQGGLLDIALHPDFESNSFVYLTYSASYRLGFGTRVARARLTADALVDVQVIFEMESASRTTHHFGSRIAFAGDGTLFLTIGDRGDRDRAQDLSDHAGKILRINDDGTIPRDNPFVDNPDAKPEIYSYGHRNPQGLVIDKESGTVWAHEHGPQGGDEVNLIRPGVNYGWPIITYGKEYSGGEIAPSELPGYEQPIIHWTPSIAPSGLALYSGVGFPEWRGNLFAGALAGQHLRRMVVENGRIADQEVLLQNSVGRIRDVRQAPDGNIWILTDEPRGSLIRLEPAD